MSDPGQRAADRAAEEIARRIRRVYQQASDEIIERMNAYLANYRARDYEWSRRVADGEATMAEWQAWRRGQEFIGKRWEDVQHKCAGIMLNADRKANAIVNGQRMGVFAENANYLNYCFDRDAGFNLNIAFHLYDETTVDRLLRDRPELLPRRIINGIKDVAWQRINIANAVTQAILQGEGMDELAARVGRDTGTVSERAMMRYARTAMTAAQNGGRIEAMERAVDAGINVQKKWIATLDNRTRDSHQMLDGQVQDVDKPFISIYGEIRYPGDPEAEPGDVYNCRCTLGYEYPEYSQSGTRRAYNDPDSRQSDIMDYLTYTEWKARRN